MSDTNSAAEDYESLLARLISALKVEPEKIGSLGEARLLLASGQLKKEQLFVALCDEVTQGVPMRESLQVRGWLPSTPAVGSQQQTEDEIREMLYKTQPHLRPMAGTVEQAIAAVAEKGFPGALNELMVLEMRILNPLGNRPVPPEIVKQIENGLLQILDVHGEKNTVEMLLRQLARQLKGSMMDPNDMPPPGDSDPAIDQEYKALHRRIDHPPYSTLKRTT